MATRLLSSRLLNGIGGYIRCLAPAATGLFAVTLLSSHAILASKPAPQSSAFPSNVDALIVQAMKTEDHLSTFRASLKSVEHENPTPDRILGEMFANDARMLATERDIAAHLPPQRETNYTLTQDKPTHQLLLRGVTMPGGVYRQYYSASSMKSYQEGRMPDGTIYRDATLSDKPSDLPPMDCIWSGTFWHRFSADATARHVSVHIAPSDMPGLTMLLVEPKTPGTSQVRLYLTKGTTPTLRRISFTNAKSGMIEDDYRVEQKQLSEGVWYPTRAEDTVYLQSGNFRSLQRQTTTVLQNLEINPQLQPADLAFGELPHDTTISYK